MRHRSRWAWMGLVTIAAAGAASAVPVGMASHISGQPKVNGKPLRLLQRLDAGATVSCGPGAEADIVLFGNGSRYKVGAGRTGTVQENSVAGATPMAGLSGPSSRVAKALGGSRAGALMARPASQSHSKLQVAGPDWMTEGQGHFAWDSIAGAATYSFTLFDQADNVVWSTRVAESQADYPADLPALSLRQPYVWRLGAFGRMGKPSGLIHWGVITFLSQADADELTTQVAALQDQLKDTRSDEPTPRLMLAELYRNYGVYEKTLSILEDQKLANQPGVTQAKEDAYRQVSRYACFLANVPPNRVDDGAAPGTDLNGSLTVH